MADEQPIAWQRFDGNDCVSRGPVLFHGFILNPDTLAAAGVTFYHGVNSSGRPLFRAVTPATQSLPVFFPKPLYLEDGLYLGAIANIDNVLVLYEPLPE